MRVQIIATKSSVDKTIGVLDGIIRDVHYGAKWATEQACRDIEELSLREVPRGTDALADSIGHNVEKSGSKFIGSVFYGRDGSVNPETGEPVSAYCLRQHEDLTFWHPVGKAKFLEDPLNAYAASDEYKRLMEEATRRAIERRKLIEDNKKAAELEKVKAQMRKGMKEARERYEREQANKSAKRTKSTRKTTRKTSTKKASTRKASTTSSISDLAAELAGVSKPARKANKSGKTKKSSQTTSLHDFAAELAGM